MLIISGIPPPPPAPPPMPRNISAMPAMFPKPASAPGGNPEDWEGGTFSSGTRGGGSSSVIRSSAFVRPDLRFAFDGFELVNYSEHFVDKWHDTNCGVVRKRVQPLAKVHL